MKTNDLIKILQRTTDIFKLGTTEVSAGTGYSRSTVNRWRKKQATMSLAQFVDWAEYLGYEVRLYRRDISTDTTV